MMGDDMLGAKMEEAKRMDGAKGMGKAYLDVGLWAAISRMGL